MLEIRKVQLAALDNLRRKKIEAQLAERILVFFPDVVAARFPEPIEPFVSKLVDDALGFGIRRVSSVERYVDLACLLRDDFPHGPRHDWARAILTRHTLSGDAKVEALAAAIDAASEPASTAGRSA